MRQRIKVNVPVYIDGKLTGDTRGEDVKYRIRKLKRELGPIEVVTYYCVMFGIEKIIPEGELEMYKKAGITIYQKISYLLR
jgi:hypothetical protein